MKKFRQASPKTSPRRHILVVGDEIQFPSGAADEPWISLNYKEINMIKKAKDVFGDQELAVVTFRVPRDLFAEFLCICTRRGEQHRVVIAEMVDQYVREHYGEFVQSVVSSPKAGVRVHVSCGENGGEEGHANA